MWYKTWNYHCRNSYTCDLLEFGFFTISYVLQHILISHYAYKWTMSFALHKWHRSLNTLPLLQLNFSQLCFHLLNMNSWWSWSYERPHATLLTIGESVSADRWHALPACSLKTDTGVLLPPTGPVMIVRIGWLLIGLIVMTPMRLNSTLLLNGIRNALRIWCFWISVLGMRLIFFCK